MSESGRRSGSGGGVSLGFFGGGRDPTVFSSSRGVIETSKGKAVKMEEGTISLGF